MNFSFSLQVHAMRLWVHFSQFHALFLSPNHPVTLMFPVLSIMILSMCLLIIVNLLPNLPPCMPWWVWRIRLLTLSGLLLPCPPKVITWLRIMPFCSPVSQTFLAVNSLFSPTSIHNFCERPWVFIMILMCLPSLSLGSQLTLRRPFLWVLSTQEITKGHRNYINPGSQIPQVEARKRCSRDLFTSCGRATALIDRHFW